MMKLARRPLRVAQAERYYSEKFSHDEYYSEDQTVAGHWRGKGAVTLGLTGEVVHEDFTALLNGIHPRTRAVLVATGSNGEHNAAYDAVFSVPKSVSIQALVGGDMRLLDAHQRAVATTLAEVEQFALAHQKRGREYVVTGNVVAALWDHLATRESSAGTLDPQIHTHAVLLNVTRRPDGEWRSLCSREIYKCQGFASALYLSELASEVQKLGYKVESRSHYGAWEIAGYTHDQCYAFAQRSKDIDDRMAKLGLQGPAAAHVSAMATRKPKKEENLPELQAEWRQRATAHGIQPGNNMRQALKRGPIPISTDPNIVRDAVSFAREHCSEREAVVDRRQLEENALEHAIGKVDLKQVRAQIAVEQQQGRLIKAGDDAPTHYQGKDGGAYGWHPGGAFTTDEMVRLERANLEMVRAGVGKAQPIADRYDATIWAINKGLLPDQIGVAVQTLAASHRFSAIEGPAGSTKTTVVGAIREFAESQGYVVRGFGMSSGSVDVLRDAGINSQTIASLLANPLPVPGAPELWFVDESSLVSTRDANGLLKAAAELGVERIVFVGDQRQHHAIEAGAPVKQFLADHMMVAELTQIRRQKDPQLLHAVELARKHPGQALDLLEEQGRVHEIAETEPRYQRIALDFIRSYECAQKTLVVSPGNDERKALNIEIRKLLVNEGHVEKQGREQAILVNRNLTMAQRQHAASYNEGDVLRFSKGARGIARGSYLVVKGVDWNNNSLILHGRDGAEIRFDPAFTKRVQVYEWERREIAIGDRLQFRIHDHEHNVPNNAFAVITELNSHSARLKFSTREIDIPLAQLRHIDYGYASTSHAAQGAGVDRVLVNIDTQRGDQLVNAAQFYVSCSRAKLDAQIFTDDKEALRRVIMRNPEKEIALDALQEQQKQQQVQQPIQQSIGMSF